MCGWAQDRTGFGLPPSRRKKLSKLQCIALETNQALLPLGWMENCNAEPKLVFFLRPNSDREGACARAPSTAKPINKHNVIGEKSPTTFIKKQNISEVAFELVNTYIKASAADSIAYGRFFIFPNMPTMCTEKLHEFGVAT